MAPPCDQGPEVPWWSQTEVLPKLWLPVSCQTSGFFPCLLASESQLDRTGQSLLLLCTEARGKTAQGLLLAMALPPYHGTWHHNSPKSGNA